MLASSAVDHAQSHTYPITSDRIPCLHLSYFVDNADPYHPPFSLPRRATRLSPYLIPIGSRTLPAASTLPCGMCVRACVRLLYVTSHGRLLAWEKLIQLRRDWSELDPVVQLRGPDLGDYREG
jgi:hypothetical protein